MNRRSFLAALSTAAVGVAVSSLLPDDPERLLWVPGQKTFFLPAAPTTLHGVDFSCGKDWTVITTVGPSFESELSADMIAHSFLTPDVITREALTLLEKQLHLAKIINRRYDDAFRALSTLVAEARKDLEFLNGEQWPRPGLMVIPRKPKRFA